MHFFAVRLSLICVKPLVRCENKIFTTKHMNLESILKYHILSMPFQIMLQCCVCKARKASNRDVFDPILLDEDTNDDVLEDSLSLRFAVRQSGMINVKLGVMLIF